MNLSTPLFPSIGPIAPPPGLLGAVVAVFQIYAALTSYAHELRKPSEYSKFASVKQENPISSQNGMFRMYVPSAIVATLVTWTTFNTDNFALANPLLCIHFWKRTLEVAFVHRYSGTMPAGSANKIGTYYALFTLMIGSWAAPLGQINPEWQDVGIKIFTLGLIGNGYHHWLLSKLRSTKDPLTNKKKYVPPRGGLFFLISAPHYLLELVGWLGIAITAQQLNAFLTLTSMSSYLAARARLTNSKYMDEFTKEEWPRSRKALIPFLF